MADFNLKGGGININPVVYEILWSNTSNDDGKMDEDDALNRVYHASKQPPGIIWVLIEKSPNQASQNRRVLDFSEKTAGLNPAVPAVTAG